MAQTVARTHQVCAHMQACATQTDVLQIALLGLKIPLVAAAAAGRLSISVQQEVEEPAGVSL